MIASAGDRVRSVAEAKELAAGIPNAELVVMNGAGHMLPMEAPEDLARGILKWVRSRAANGF